MPSLMKICPMGADLFRGTGRTVRQADMKTVVVALLSFANEPKI